MPSIRRFARDFAVRWCVRAMVALLVALAGSGAAFAVDEPPALAADVAAGKLAPMAERLPAEPLVVNMPATGRVPGRYGGSLRVIEAQARDTRRMVVFGYARLVGTTPGGRIEPDLARAVDVEDGRIFTIHLRRGHKWSDGAPFTAEDFRYYWEDVVNDPKLGKNGLPRELLVDGEGPTVTFPDEVTIRYEWAKPNPFFLPAMARSLALEIFRPAHYLKQFHQKYADPAALEARVAAEGQRNWVALHFKMDQSYKNTSVELPSLQPWVLATAPPADRFVFRRNPYFHRVDEAGRQLPYIDEVAMAIASPGLIPAMVGAGAADLQANYMTFGNYAFVKRAADRWNYDVLRWKSGRGNRVVLYPDLNARDEVWRALFQTADFRRALSMAINREDINQAIYYGLARPTNDTVLPASPLWTPELAQRWATYDPAAAGALLDGLGLQKRDSGGIRLLPDGRAANIVVEVGGEEGEQVDVLQLVAEDWRRVGIGLVLKTVEKDTLGSRLAAGSTLMSVAPGLENGIARPADSPAELAPTDSAQASWPAWGLHVESGGKLGAEPTLPFARELLDLNRRWRATLDEGERTAIWGRMLTINADETPRIGLVAGVDQIVVASRRLRNLPREGVYNWEPGALFGMYRPDTFFFEEDRQALVEPN
ncbi:ABC transporter substrate-binding protein [Aureimonas pseudogalii]|uniref:Peptide/nickel transport system substrate-binding protein n=1 Tax=Aureimonas pseudogalii TaxID=1744844 RepID=A0A7W6E7V4_9HYPH|nr:ABC transporter substrate-binding protein [Aureimonas pseudogalii]MBB3996366.1 peptide/nickel transport system substrate-binding protein [Aureimonas pseudogalii]